MADIPLCPTFPHPILVRTTPLIGALDRSTPAVLRRTATVMLSLAALTACGSRPAPTTTPSPVSGADSAALAAERAVGRVSGRALGVPPFAVRSSDARLTPLSFALADLITTDLARSGQLSLVERTRLSDVLRELELAATGRVDSATAPRVGRLVSASRLVIGSLDQLPGSDGLRLGVRLANVEQGTVTQTIDAQAPLADILAAEKALVFRIFDALGVVLTPAERQAIERRATRDLGALLAYGAGVQAEYLGDFRTAASEYRRAERLDPSFEGIGERAQEARARSETAVINPIAFPGLRSRDAAVSTTIDRLNRPLDLITGATRNTGGLADPSFPITSATVLITVTRP